jgi:hypothetical protein
MNLQNVIGFGIAGNFAGHLEQAGEAGDFQAVEVKEAVQPKAIFPFYVPAEQSGFLATYPLSNDTILIPEQGGNIQIEPEVAIYCQLQYHDDGTTVKEIRPLKFSAYNDCSIRRPNAKKISEKKNWGKSSKGISATWIDIDQFAENGLMDNYRIACFLKRDGQLIEYGVDSQVKEYSYFHQNLLDWLVDKMNHQQDQGPMEHIASHLKHANYPEHALISIGATRYTEFGESHFLQEGDESCVVVYDQTRYSPDEIKTKLQQADVSGEGMSVLIQQIRQASRMRCLVL